LKALLVLIEAQ